MSNNSKKKKFQIEPNSISSNEEAAVKNVLQNFRNRSPRIDNESTSENIAVHANKVLPSTNEIETRPQTKDFAVHNFSILPSTIIESGRPQINELPSITLPDGRPQELSATSTPKSVDVLPSTEQGETPAVDVLPSTNKRSAVHKSKVLPSTNNDRHSKDLARFDNRIDSQIKQRIAVFCAKFSLSNREFVEQSAVHFINVWTAKLEKNVDGKTAHDDRLSMMLWKSDFRIINLYRAYNFENRWKIKDDEAAQTYTSVDLRIIELGIIETQFNSKFKKINSFGYYQNEIEKFIEQKLDVKTLDFLIKHYRTKWQQATGKELDLDFLLEEKDYVNQ